MIGGVPVRHIDDLPELVGDGGVASASSPPRPQSAQDAADRLVGAGRHAPS